jgi:pilus assembly protein CpaC
MKAGALIKIAIVVAAMFCATTIAPVPVAWSSASSITVSAGAPAKVRVAVGKSTTVGSAESFGDVVVGDPEIADVMPLTDRSFYVLGKAIGATNVALFDAHGRLVGVTDVEVSYDIETLATEIRQRLPAPSITVRSVNGRIMLSGTVPDAATLDRALSIAREFGAEVINSMTVEQSQQVMLEVRFVEASRTAGRELGVGWEAVGNNLFAVSGVGGLATGSMPFGVLVGRLLDNGVEADVLIKALEERGLARRLAEPNLVALSGDTASFLAGGEFPFPVRSESDTVTIEFKRFGVGLAFTPTVLGDGLINLRIIPEVSQLDPTNSVQVGGVQVPGLVVRRAETTVELRDGQSFAIAGLLQSINTTTQRQLPWLGQVPVIGALFRSAAFRRQETDLAIIVTPRLVRPSAPGEPMRTPLDDTEPANDLDFFLLGHSEVTTRMQRMESGDRVIKAGHIIDLPQR